MNKKVLKLEIIGFIVVCILGTLLHFLFNWSGNNSFISLFCTVNESIWEHQKLLFFPYFAYGIFESIKLSQDKFNVYFAKLIGIIAGIIVTLSITYISSGATGKEISWINIASFFVGILIAFTISYSLLKKSIGKSFWNGFALVILILISIIFFFFTYFPIKIPLFQDPQNFTYGISSHK